MKTKYDVVTLPFRAANGGRFRTLKTTSATNGEDKEGSLPSKREIKNDEKNDGGSKESAKLEGETPTELHEDVRMTAETVEQTVVEVNMTTETVIQLTNDLKSTSVIEATEHEEMNTVDQTAKMDITAENFTELMSDVKSESLNEPIKHEESTKIEVMMVVENDTKFKDPVKTMDVNDATKRDTVEPTVEVTMTVEKVEQLMDDRSESITELPKQEEMCMVEQTLEVTKLLDDVKTVSVTEEPRPGQTMKPEVVEPTLEVEMEISKVEEGVPQGEMKEVKQSEEPQKTGKESLLDLLGAMKVEVTNKKNFKSLKVQGSSKPVARPKPAEMESTISMFQNASVPAAAPTSVQSETLSPELVAAASAAASTLPNQSQAESELLKQLKQHEALADAQKMGEVTNIGNIIADMKVGKKPNARLNAWPANQIRFDDDERFTDDRGITTPMEGMRGRRSLFSRKRLNIFAPSSEQNDEAAVNIAYPTLWDIELANQVALSANQQPRNGFEEMIQWTKEGKLWQYPINNETGLEEEASIPFHEHVFLDKQLEDGFPRQGPVRHFMELVVAGLSKNPHLTVAQKREHIDWFREYFQQKEEVLKEAEVYLN